jgi:hypothetical protein
MIDPPDGPKPFRPKEHNWRRAAKAPIPRLPERLSSIQPLIDTLLAKEPAGRPADADTAGKLIQPGAHARFARCGCRSMV